MNLHDYDTPIYLFFFFKQKTAYEMRISDWSSDVCSSDLESAPRPATALPRPRQPFGDEHRPDTRAAAHHDAQLAAIAVAVAVDFFEAEGARVEPHPPRCRRCDISDRKSTRLNSSH